MTGSWWWDLLVGVAAALAVTWLALLVTLAIVRPRGGLLREALRLLPDVLRLVRRLSADPDLPPGVRVRLALLLAYLAVPLDLVPDFPPRVGLRRRRHHRHRGAPLGGAARRADSGTPSLARHPRRLHRPLPPHRPERVEPDAVTTSVGLRSARLSPP